MLEPPNLNESWLVSCLRDAYGLQAAQVDFLPLGADPGTAVYRVVALDQAPCFLKLRSGAFDPNSVTVPRLLYDLGIEQIIPPLTTLSGGLWAAVDGFTAILYPFIVGVDGYSRALSDSQWREFGAAMRRIHAVTLGQELRQRIPQETFSTRWRDAVRGYMARIERETFADPVAAQVATLLQGHRADVFDLVDNADRFGRELLAQPLDLVLCHTDLHAGNLLMTEEGRIYIVDWDAPLLAPRERDLMYVGGGQMAGWLPPREEEVLFYRGYGHTSLNQTALAYYRYQRIVEDIAAFCQQLLDSTDGGEDREQSLRYLKYNFLPQGLIAVTRAQHGGINCGPSQIKA